MEKEGGVNTEIWSNPISYSRRYTPTKTFLLRAEVTERNEGNTVGNEPYNMLFGKCASRNVQKNWFIHI